MVVTARPDLHVESLMLRWYREAEGEKPTFGQRSGGDLPAALPPRLGSWRALQPDHHSLPKDPDVPARRDLTTASDQRQCSSCDRTFYDL